MIDHILLRFIIDILPLDAAGSAIRTGFLDPPFREVPFAIAVAMLLAVGNAWWRDGGKYTLRRAIRLRKIPIFIGLWAVILIVFTLFGYLLNPLLLLSWYLAWASLGSLGCSLVVWGAVYASTADALALDGGVYPAETSFQTELSTTRVCIGATSSDVVENVVVGVAPLEQPSAQEDDQVVLQASQTRTAAGPTTNAVPQDHEVSHHGHYPSKHQSAERRKAKQHLRRVLVEQQSHLRHKSRRAS